MLQARADAQAALWFNTWEQAALDEDWVLTGKAAVKSAEETAGTWASRTLGAAEADVTAKTTLETAALAEENAAKRW